LQPVLPLIVPSAEKSAVGSVSATTLRIAPS
jgi:hypothetical protein